ncbi:hypothetical protein V6N13_081461 [Hibiscus sabdariffa]
MRALLWVKAVDDLSCFTESSWWDTPIACFKFQQVESDKQRPIFPGFVTFIVVGTVSKHGAGCGGSLRTDSGHIDNLVKSLSHVQFQLVSRDVISMAESLAKLGIQRSETFKAWW